MTDGTERTLPENVAAPDFAALHAAQAALCKAKGYPHFVPRVCWGCHQEVYSHSHAAAIAATGHMTGCYHCHKSYCD